ncbi:MAG: hypothetical protein AAGE01_11490 [Pseudomonadota bacterium]
MTGLSASPKVDKGAIVGLDIFNPVSSVAIFQYNPDQLTRSLAPNYSQAGGGQAEPLRLAGPPTETISANLKMDLVDQMEQGENGPLGGGISGYLAALEMLVYPKSVAVAINQGLMLAGTMEVVQPAAPLTLFVYGWKRVVPVKIESLSITETAHDTALNPIRADVSVSMKVLTYNDLSMTNPGYWAFLTHQVVKETLATVASVENVAHFVDNLDI